MTAVSKAQGGDTAGGQSSKETAVLSSATKVLVDMKTMESSVRQIAVVNPVKDVQRTSESTPGQTPGNQVSSQLRPVKIARGPATPAQVVPVVQQPIVGAAVTLVVPVSKPSISARPGVPTKVPSPLTCHQLATLALMSQAIPGQMFLSQPSPWRPGKS